MILSRVALRGLAGRVGEEWSARSFHLLTALGVAAVVAGSYLPWATFYGGLVARDGVAGHGRYFIGAAAAAGSLALATALPGVWRGLRWLLVLAGLAIIAVALRDLRNLTALTHAPGAAGFYLPGRGPGLFVVFGGGLALALAPFAGWSRAPGRPDPWLTLAVVTAAAALALAVPGLYGEYYARLAPGHLPWRGGALSESGLLTISAGLTAIVTAPLLLLSLAGRLHAATPLASSAGGGSEALDRRASRRRRIRSDAAGGS